MRTLTGALWDDSNESTYAVLQYLMHLMSHTHPLTYMRSVVFHLCGKASHVFHPQPSPQQSARRGHRSLKAVLVHRPIWISGDATADMLLDTNCEKETSQQSSPKTGVRELSPPHRRTLSQTNSRPCGKCKREGMTFYASDQQH